MHKVLYIWKSPYPWDVRVEKVCRALGNAGFDVTLLCRWQEGQSEREDSANFHIIRTGYAQPGYKYVPVSINPYWQNEIRKAIHECKPDIIIPREIMLAEAAAQAAHKFNIPSVIDMAEHYPSAMKLWKKYNKTFTRRLLVHYLSLPEYVEKRSVRISDGIITVCKEQNDRLTHTYGFDRNKIQVVHNTPPAESIEDSGITYSLSNSNSITFGHHGFMTDEKNLKVFLKGFILAFSKNPNFKLILAGSGDSVPELKELSERSDARGNIEFTGSYSYNELTGILQRIDVGIVPYPVNDFNNHTIHNKVFDYFAAGKPQIVSNTKPFLRLMNETGAGVAVDCSNTEAIADCLLGISSKYDLKSMAVNARKAALEKYNWNVDSANLVSFIKRMIE